MNEQVENIILDVPSWALCCNALNETLTVSSTNNDFTVDKRVSRQLLAGVGNCRKPVCEAAAASGPEHDATAPPSSQAVVAVELGLIGPQAAVRSFPNRGNLHGLDKGRVASM